MCLVSSVEYIRPDYSEQITLPEGSGESDSSTIDCPKLTLDKPYNGTDYSIILKPKSSTNTLYHILFTIETAGLNDDTLMFKYHYSVRKGNQLLMVAAMNTKALEMVSIKIRTTK